MRHILIIIASLIIFNSCKDKDQPVPESSNSIMTGQQGININCINYTPDLSLENIQAGCMYFYDKDSMDIDHNKTIDIEIIYSCKAPDFSGACCVYPPGSDSMIYDCLPYGNGSIYINILNDEFSIATDSSKYIKAFPTNQSIDNSLIWNNSSSLFFYDWYFFDATPVFQNGYWIKAKDKYLALKHKRGAKISYGWMRISTYDSGNVVFAINEVALQN